MPLSWNEIRARALAFSKEWESEESEHAEAQSFWNDFFNVFGVTRRRIASFEKPVNRPDGSSGNIDLLWKGMVLVEHKSRGKSLDKAYKQAVDYFPGLNDRDLPRYVIVSDFARIRLYDIESYEDPIEFPLKDLHKNVRHFGFMAGYQTRTFGQEDPVNIKAAEKLGLLHDQLKASGYEGHELEVYLVRLLFCLFAEDTGIFEPGQLREYISLRTEVDGSDLGMHLAQLFQVLNTPEGKRQGSLDEQLAAFPYINGRLFEETLSIAAFDRSMRETLMDCATLDWSRISPAIFGSLFQSIMDDEARRNIGAHYTSETNILKALGPLFLDGLRDELWRIRGNKQKLRSFHEKLANIRILDPACGCGNFLVVAYRELRKLELDVLKRLHGKEQTSFDLDSFVKLNVDQFHGIEIEEFPAQIAQVAMWLVDHQMNTLVMNEFGQYFVRLPLRKAANIVHGNALRIDWADVVKPSELSYIVGNPPYVGARIMSAAQKIEVESSFPDNRSVGLLDYVSCWFRKAADYMQNNTSINTAFVATNSISQGEQVGALWPGLIALGVRINFAHRTFQWTSEARGRAAVHCVIIGFALEDAPSKSIFDYESPKAAPLALKANTINSYLVDAGPVTLESRRSAISPVPAIVFGSMPNDGGHLLLSPEEKAALLKKHPEANKWIRRTLGSTEFINNKERWCLWLEGISPDELRRMPAVLERVDAVRSYRLSSTRTATQRLADTPSLFGEIRHPKKGHYLLVPSVSSERRPFIPIGFMFYKVISTNLNLIIPDATLYHFGIITSTMHMSWVRAVCGRLKSDYRYSAGIVYNNFPWPKPTDKQRQAIEKTAQGVLDAREKFPGSSLADLYDPLTMPPELMKAHKTLDKAVDKAYGNKTFKSEAERVAMLFAMYQKLTSILPTEAPKKKSNRKRTR